MDVEMPDGVLVRDVPDGMTKSQLLQRYNKSSQKYTDVSPAAPSFIEQATSNVSPINDPSRMAGVGDQAVASLPTDMKERASYFAKQRFPNDPNGIGKYGVQDGRLFYTGDNGELYYEEPSLSMSPTELAKYGASSAGPAMPVVGSIAGGIGGEILNPFGGGIPAAGVGAAAGDEMRQGLAMLFSGQKDFKPSQTLSEGATGAAGQVLGVAGSKFLNRYAARDIEKALTPEARAKIDYLESSAKEFGYTLTPAEKTGLSSLSAQQNVLESLPRSSDKITGFYKERAQNQDPAAVNQFLGKLSPIESYEVGAQSLQSGAKDTIKAEMSARQAAAKPFYDSSRDTPIPMDAYNELLKDPFLAKQIRIVKSDPKYQSDISDLFPKGGKSRTGQDAAGNDITITSPPTEAKIGYLDVVKKRIDGLIETAKTAGNKNDVRIFTAARNKIANKEGTGVADIASPDYFKARSIFEEGSPPVTSLTKGEVGMAAKDKMINLDQIPKLIFESGANAVKSNRAAFIKAGKEQEWNDGLRSYLQSNFTRAAKEFKTGNTTPGASFKAQVMGTNRQKAAMREAMNSDQWATFNRLMDVLEASGKVPRGGTRTAFAAEGIKDLKTEASGVVGKALRAINPSNIIDTSKPAAVWGEIKLGKHAEKLADIITSPEAMSQLRSLKKLSPNSEAAMAIVSQILFQYGLSEVGTPQNVAPGQW